MSTEWREIPGTEGLYEASSGGQIRRVGGKILKPGTAGRARQYTLYRPSVRGRKLHGTGARFVCMAFHGPAPEGHDADHISKNTRDDSAGNVRWRKQEENRATAKRAKPYLDPSCLVGKLG